MTHWVRGPEELVAVVKCVRHSEMTGQEAWPGGLSHLLLVLLLNKERRSWTLTEGVF